MTTLAWILVAFVAGSIPFSVLVGRLALRTDIRQYGDYNPGATNVARAGGLGWGGLALLLDMLKGAIPAGAAWFFGGVTGWPLAAVALAPILGHAYSPFLRFQGGKAIAVTGGVWGGLTVGEAPVLMAMMLVAWYAVLAVEGWAVVLTLLSFGVYLVLADGTNTTLLAVWAGTLLILAWKHRADLAKPITFRPWLRKMVE